MGNNGYNGFQRPSSASSDFNSIDFVVQSMMNGMATATLVKVMAVTNAGAVSPVGFVDILPLVNQVDGVGTAVPHGTVYKCPYQRMQGGANAIILDPQVGDIGVAVFADRDISSATANKAQSNPGSARRFDMSDGLYLGGFLNGTPTQFVQFSAAGIQITSPTAIKLSAPTITLTGNTTVDGTLTVTGLVTAGELLSGIATFTSSVEIGGKNLGAGHEHNLTGGGTTLGVV